MPEEAEAAFDILLQPTRFKLATYILKAVDPLYLDQIATMMGENPRLISHHLDVLEDLGLVESKFEVIQKEGMGRGFAGRFFTPTPKLGEALATIGNMALARRETG